MLKIKKSDADFIKYGLEKYNNDKEKFFNNVISSMTLWNTETERNISSSLSPYELAEALFEGYEVELTPEEQVEVLYYDYIRNKEIYLDNNKLDEAQWLNAKIDTIRELNSILKLGLDLG